MQSLMSLCMQSPVGELTLAADNKALVEIRFGKSTVDTVVAENAILVKVRQQLEAYFAGDKTSFELPLNPAGTAFQQAVWRQLQEVDYGETASYADIAAAIKRPKAVRAVGAANGRNPIPIIIPCHRIIGSNGTLTGYAGGLDMKQKLLKLESHQKILI